MNFIRRSLGIVNILQKVPSIKRFQHTNVRLSDVAANTVFGDINKHRESIALRDSIGSYTFANLLQSSKQLADEISKQLDGKTNQHVLFLCPNDASYVITLWAIWISGQVAVPLSSLHPKSLLTYYANDTKASLLVSTRQHADLMQRIALNNNARLYVLDDKLRLNCPANQVRQADDVVDLVQSNGERDALVIYTSGTTGNPKGVVLTHKNLKFQIETLIEAWKWSGADCILHTLPLYHIHGIVNALLCPLYVGAQTVLLPKFDTNAAWSHLLDVNHKPGANRVNVFMAVPTIYSKLIDEYDKVFGSDPKMVEYIRGTLKARMRLMVSGSAPLPTQLFNRWLEVSGHRLLERYGMTEIGMCLSNSYEFDGREPGFIGVPLPGVSVKLQDDSTNDLIECGTDLNCKTNVIQAAKLDDSETVSGELLVKSDGVFSGYLNRPLATEKEFTQDKWFKTGDIVAYHLRKRKFQILGRKSSDIIKSGGFKISAIGIETIISEHNDVKEVVVVGLDDVQWGQQVAAVLVLQKNKNINLEALQDWCAEKMPKYSVPKILKIVDEIPKNAMGKVNKKELVQNVF